MESTGYKGAFKFCFGETGLFNLKLFPDKICIGIHLIIITKLQYLIGVRKILRGLETLPRKLFQNPSQDIRIASSVY